MKKNESHMKQWNMDRWVPHYVPASVVLGVLELSSWWRIPSAMIKQHHRDNSAVWKEKRVGVLDADGIYIENQSRLSFLQYGRQSDWLSRILLEGRRLNGVENTCEVIAVYNCLCYLEYSAENEQKCHGFDMKINHNQGIIWEEQGFPYLLYFFERHGLALGGYFGTSPMAMKRLFVKLGYHVSVIKGKEITESVLDGWSAEEHFPVAYILTAYNDANHLSHMVHTMCITRTEEGYVLHNDYEGTRQYGSLSDSVFGYREGQSKPILMMKIMKK